MYSREKIDQRNLARIYSTTSRLESKMFESAFVATDKFLGRAPILGGLAGAGAGAGVAHLMGKSTPIGAAIGAVAGVAGTEAGRALFTDKKVLLELQVKDLKDQEKELISKIEELEKKAKAEVETKVETEK